jgi:hypothetical protein
MAQLPLNTFKTKTKILGINTGTTSTVYTAPIGITSIVLMAQVANLTTATAAVTFIHYRNRPVLADAQGNGRQEGQTESILVNQFGVPANDAGVPLAGKMIIESLDSVRAYADTPNALQLVLSVLETANA